MTTPSAPAKTRTATATASKAKTAVAGPFLKWAGGKGQLAQHIKARLPAQIDTYYEPFIGGGAIFFALAAEGRFRSAVLADRNAALVEAYEVVRDNVEQLISLLRGHRHEEAYFYEVRAQDPTSLDKVERVSRLVFLNRTCFNGLYRVNRSGRFNVPFGRYKNPTLCDADNLRNASAVLRDVKVYLADFEDIVGKTKPGDAVYFDPPYYPLSKTSSFTAYDPYPFREPEQERLATVHRGLGERGVFSLLSNSDCAYTRSLYAGLDVETVEATRAINSVGDKRGKITELLVRARPEQVSAALPKT